MSKYDEIAKRMHESLKEEQKERIIGLLQDVRAMSHQIKDLKGKKGYRQALHERRELQKRVNNLEEAYEKTYGEPVREKKVHKPTPKFVEPKIQYQVNDTARARLIAGRDYKSNPVPENKLNRFGLTPAQIAEINS